MTFKNYLGLGLILTIATGAFSVPPKRVRLLKKHFEDNGAKRAARGESLVHCTFCRKKITSLAAMRVCAKDGIYVIRDISALGIDLSVEMVRELEALCVLFVTIINRAQDNETTISEREILALSKILDSGLARLKAMYERLAEDVPSSSNPPSAKST